MKKTWLKWKGRRAQREQAQLREFRRLVQARAMGKCERCQAVAGSEPHHLWPRSRATGGWKHHPDNGVWLCHDCHRRITDGSGSDAACWILTSAQAQRLGTPEAGPGPRTILGLDP